MYSHLSIVLRNLDMNYSKFFELTCTIHCLYRLPYRLLDFTCALTNEHTPLAPLLRSTEYTPSAQFP